MKSVYGNNSIGNVDNYLGSSMNNSSHNLSKGVFALLNMVIYILFFRLLRRKKICKLEFHFVLKVYFKLRLIPSNFLKRIKNL